MADILWILESHLAKELGRGRINDDDEEYGGECCRGMTFGVWRIPTGVAGVLEGG